MAATPSLDTVNPQGDSAGAPCINRRPKVPPVLALASTREIASPYPFWIQRKPRRLITGELIPVILKARPAELINTSAPASTDPEYGQFATYITPTRNFVDMPPPFLPSKLRRKVVTFLVSGKLLITSICYRRKFERHILQKRPCIPSPHHPRSLQIARRFLKQPHVPVRGPRQAWRRHGSPRDFEQS